RGRDVARPADAEEMAGHRSMYRRRSHRLMAQARRERVLAFHPSRPSGWDGSPQGLARELDPGQPLRPRPHAKQPPRERLPAQGRRVEALARGGDVELVETRPPEGAGGDAPDRQLDALEQAAAARVPAADAAAVPLRD